ncbi:hypothetical protein [Novosphingobium beihaiensis]|uniref:Uncharacterized protein n=1 Tax=Novosphingobium beihaiensis TaxID=2930389 RepID=A0ABT0BVV0_9SPHN|nr:hypothetical protein [Novosphingobium beihaiensis]MCJ2189174.1 hypothetical protein [Novosphingobium beihaiensis]
MASEKQSVKGAVFASAVILKSVADMYDSIEPSIAEAHVTAAIDAACKEAEIDPDAFCSPPPPDQSQLPGSHNTPCDRKPSGFGSMPG